MSWLSSIIRGGGGGSVLGLAANLLGLGGGGGDSGASDEQKRLLRYQREQLERYYPQLITSELQRYREPGGGTAERQALARYREGVDADYADAAARYAHNMERRGLGRSSIASSGQAALEAARAADLGDFRYRQEQEREQRRQQALSNVTGMVTGQGGQALSLAGRYGNLAEQDAARRQRRLDQVAQLAYALGTPAPEMPPTGDAATSATSPYIVYGGGGDTYRGGNAGYYGGLPLGNTTLYRYGTGGYALPSYALDL